MTNTERQDLRDFLAIQCMKWRKMEYHQFLALYNQTVYDASYCHRLVWVTNVYHRYSSFIYHR